MSVVSRLDRYQRRHHWLGLPIAVLYKFFEDQGNYLASIITYYGFLSLFPLLLLFVTVLGYLLRGDVQLQQQLLNSALAQFPIVGGELQRSTHALTGSPGGVIVGIVGALYGGLGVIQAAQNAFNRAYAVPRQDRPDPLHSRLRSLLLLPLLFLAVAITTGLAGFSTSATALAGVWGKGAVDVLSLALNIGMFIAAFRILTAYPLSNRDVTPGAVMAGILWQVLQVVGTLVVQHRLRGSGVAGGTFGLLLGLLLWIYIVAVAVVLSCELNVVLERRLYPRALMSLVSDTDDLTHGDRAAYRSYSRSERYKTFQDIEVTFLPKEEAGAEGSEVADGREAAEDRKVRADPPDSPDVGASRH